MLFILFSGASAVDCPRASSKNPCKGECGSFSDSNRNGICDDWEKGRNEIKKKATVSTQKIPAKKSEVKAEKIPDRKDSFYDKLLKFGLVWIILANLLLILLCESLKNKSFYAAIHRDLWNNILLFSFMICALSGFILYFSFFLLLKMPFLRFISSAAAFHSFPVFTITWKDSAAFSLSGIANEQFIRQKIFF